MSEGAKMKRHVMRKQMIQCSGFFFLFLKACDFTSARVKVQFGSYFIHSAGPSLMRISAPWVPRSFCGIRFSLPHSCIRHLNYDMARTWPNIDNVACLISRTLQEQIHSIVSRSVFPNLLPKLWTLLFYFCCSRDQRWFFKKKIKTGFI